MENNYKKKKKRVLFFRKLFFIKFILIGSIGLTQNIEAQTYCPTSVSTNGSLYYVDSIRTTGGVTNIAHTNNAPIVVNSNGYTDLTSLVVSGLQGGSFQLQLYGRQLYEYHWNVFIDWNQNGILDDPGELVYSYLTGTRIRATSTTVNIPLNAVPGNTRMRIAMYRISTTLDPCTSTGVSGYVNDFTVNVLPLATCSNPIVGGTATVSPATPICPGSSAVLNLSGITYAGNQTYEWESSSDNITYTSLGAAINTPNLTVSPLADTWYRCKVVCSGGSPEYSTPVYVALSSGLAGNYTIDASLATGGNNFSSFADFTSALICGVTGPVVVDVVAGSGPYNEIVTIGDIPGASAINTIRLNGNGEQLSFNSTGTTDHRIFTLNGTKYFTLDNLHIKALNPSYGWGVHITGTAQFDSIVNCHIDLTEVTSTSSSNTGGIVMSGSATSPTTGTTGASDIYILNNHVEAGGNGAGGGYYGIVAGGTSSSNNAQRVFINGNELSNFYYYGVDARYIENGEVSHNDIHRSNKTAITSCYPLRVYYGINLRVEGNRIHDLAESSTNSTSSLYGIYPYYTKNSIFANNVIYNMGNYTGTQYLFYPYYTDDCKFYYNTINADVVSGTSTSSMYGFYLYYGTNADVKNNIVNITGGNAGTKYGMYVTPAGNTANLQRNNVNVNSTQPGTKTPYYFGTAYTSLTAFQAAFPTQEIGSLSIDPAFVAPASGNLLPTATSLLTNGLNLMAFVNKDINGILRTPTPTVGAFQQGASGTDNAGVLSLVELNDPFCAGLQDVNVIIANNGVNIINTVTVNWEVNGVAQTPFLYTGNIDIIGSTNGNLDSVIIGQYSFPAGAAANLKIWTENPNGNLDINNTDDTLQTSVQPAIFTVQLSSDTICLGDSVVVDLIANNGNLQNTGIQWDSSLDGLAFNAITGATNLSYTQTNLTADHWYRGHVTINGNTCMTDTVVTRVMNPQIVSVTHDTICGTGTATLAATGASNGGFNWYSNSTGGSPIGSGASFTTPLLTSTDTFYVAAISGSGGGLHTGKLAPTTTSTWNLEAGIRFDAYSAFLLQSAQVYPASYGNITVELRNSSGAVIQSSVINVNSGSITTPFTLPLNFNVPAGTGYYLVVLSMSGSSVSGLVREASGNSFPYTLPGIISVTSGYLTTAHTSATYYYFYNLEVGSGCSSPRQMVTANVTPPPAIIATVTQNTICKGSSTNLSVTSANPGYTYQWQPVNLAGATLTVSPDTTTEYIVWAEDQTTGPAAGCITADTVLVTVDSIATPLVIANPNAICGGDTVNVSVNMPSSKDFGLGALTGTTSSTVSPFWHSWGGVKSQYLILASELTAAGVTPGTAIQNLAVEFTSTTGHIFNSFALEIAHTTQNALTTAMITTGLTQVFSATGIQPFVGINTIPFTNNFIWDGISNIVVQTCWSNVNSGSLSNSPLIKYDNTSFVSNSYYRADNQSAATICGGTTASGTNSSRPWFRLGLYDMSQNYTYQWNSVGGTSVNFIDVPTNYTSTPIQIVYSVDVTGSNNCTSSSTDTVIVNPQPTATILSNSTVICTNDNGGFYIDASSSLNANTYLWLADNSTAPSYHVTSAGTYVLEVENLAGCSDRDTLVVTSVTPVVPVITVNYQGTQATLDAGAGFTSYLWNTLDTTQTIIVTSSGQYSVTVTDNNGCKATSAPVNLGIGINELDKVKLNLFPNPNTGSFTLSIDDFSSEDLRIDIYDVSGRIIYNQIMKEVQANMNIPMNLNQISEGVYMLKISSNTSTKTIRFTIIK